LVGWQEGDLACRKLIVDVLIGALHIIGFQFATPLASPAALKFQKCHSAYSGFLE